MNKFAIIGYSGHAYVVIDAVQKREIHVSYYAEKEEQAENPFNLEYIGFENDDNFLGWDKEIEFILGIGDNRVRENVTKLILSRKSKLCSVIHPSANIGKTVEIGQGTFIAAGAIINPMTKIGQAVIINTGAIIEHGCEINDYSHIAPGAVLTGNVYVGERSFIGANAVVKEGIEIGSDVIIGAGTVVLNDIKNGSKIVGNPGRFL